MRWHPSEMHWMGHMHMPHAHALHMHPVQWFAEHQMVLAFLLAGLIALLVLGLSGGVNTGINPSTINPYNYPMAFPFGPIN